MWSTDPKRAGRTPLFIFSFLLLFSCSIEAKTFIVTNTDNRAPGSLRDAITQANSCGKPSTIEFALRPDDAGYDCRSKSYCIQLTQELPVIRVRLSIDGYSQSGSCKNRAAIDQENNAHIAVALCCGATVSLSDEGCPTAGLVFGPGSACSSVSGLAINGFERGIEIQANNVHVSGMFLGVDTDGITSHPNTSSLVIDASATDTVIGGCKPKHRNLIGGSSQGEAILSQKNSPLLGAITNFGNHTTIQGTTINITRHGNALITTEAQRGIVSVKNNGLLIGGSLTEQRVIVAGNYDANIHLDSTSNDILQNVFSGVALDGKQPLGGGIGLRMINNHGEPTAASLEEGYSHAIIQSVFSGNSQSGIVLGDDESNYELNKTLIRSSHMGTDVTGYHKVSNGEHGIFAVWATNTLIEDSVLAHNKLNGLYQTTGTTTISTVNTSFNGLGGVNLPCEGLKRANAPCKRLEAIDGGCAFKMKRVTGIENGNNAVGTPHFSIEEL